MKTLIVSSSLNPGSRSRVLARNLEALWAGSEGERAFVDLAELDLPFCDGGSVFGDERVVSVAEKVASADGFVFATPVYSYSVNAALKNFIELTGRHMNEKYAGILCAAGGSMSYMSALGFANSLMLDYRMFIVPRFVYATGEDWDGDEVNGAIRERLNLFASEFAEFGKKMQS